MLSNIQVIFPFPQLYLLKISLYTVKYPLENKIVPGRESLHYITTPIGKAMPLNDVSHPITRQRPLLSFRLHGHTYLPRNSDLPVSATTAIDLGLGSSASTGTEEAWGKVVGK